jgi:hypothetical protein
MHISIHFGQKNLRGKANVEDINADGIIISTRS